MRKAFDSGLTLTAYYNEHDPYAAQWLRNLIAAGHIAPGYVDERSIVDVRAIDLTGYRQCHFFAGIGVWSYALRLAGWPDDREVWTGSPPCQPFSLAGKGLGKDDERHLAPHWLELVSERGPAVVFGEQVAAAIGKSWSDDLQAHVEAEGYAFGMVVLPACGVGAPHIRQRLWFVAESKTRFYEPGKPGYPELSNKNNGVADAELLRCDTRERRVVCTEEGTRSAYRAVDDRRSSNGGMGDAVDAGLEGQPRHGDGGDEPGRLEADSGGPVAEAGGDGGVADAASDGHVTADGLRQAVESSEQTGAENIWQLAGGRDNSRASNPGPTNGYWRNVDWLGCRDGKWRAVEPGTFPLVNGAASRVGRLRAYGNAINAQVAKEVILAYLQTERSE